MQTQTTMPRYLWQSGTSKMVFGEWNFAYVLPQEEGKPVKLVVPTSLQMGWIESPGYFCAAADTGRDVAAQYAETLIGSLPNHKFLSYTADGEAFAKLPLSTNNANFKYLIECYMDDYISMVIPTSREQLLHVSNSVMTGINDVFPADANDDNDPTSLKKLKKRDGQWELEKDILGFTFDGDGKTLWLEEPKRAVILQTMHKWIRASNKRQACIAFDEFHSTLSKLRHAFISIPAGKGDSFHHATRPCATNHQWCISTATNRYDTQ